MKFEFYFQCSVVWCYLLSGVGIVTRLGAGRSWVQIPAAVKYTGAHPASYSILTSIDGKANECSHNCTLPICINGVERDNFNCLRIAIPVLPIIITGMHW
jgi:hypothetical protein